MVQTHNAAYSNLSFVIFVVVVVFCAHGYVYGPLEDLWLQEPIKGSNYYSRHISVPVVDTLYRPTTHGHTLL